MTRQPQGGTVYRRDQQHRGYDEERVQLPYQQKCRGRCAAGVAACAEATHIEQQQARDGNNVGEKQNMDEPRAGRQQRPEKSGHVSDGAAYQRRTALPFPPVLSDVKNLLQGIRRHGDEQQKKLAQQQLTQRQKLCRDVHQKQRYADNDRRQRQNAHRQMQDLRRL